MIQSSYAENRPRRKVVRFLIADFPRVENHSPLFRVLSDDQVREIKQAAFDVLEHAGCAVLHEGPRQ